jgi:hypothetical protein
MTVEAGAAGPRVGPAVDAALNSRRAAFASLLVQLSSPYGGCFTAIPRPRTLKQR